jgi:hypothetical protein
MTDEGAVTFNLDYVIKMSKNNQLIKEKEQKTTSDNEGQTPTRKILFDWQEEAKQIYQKIIQTQS